MDSGSFSYALNEVVIVNGGQVGEIGVGVADVKKVNVRVQADVDWSIVG